MLHYLLFHDGEEEGLNSYDFLRSSVSDGAVLRLAKRCSFISCDFRFKVVKFGTVGESIAASFSSSNSLDSLFSFFLFSFLLSQAFLPILASLSLEQSLILLLEGHFLCLEFSILLWIPEI